ncbi:hypothetical protein GCM10027280_45560 [Micromonospora polyrhachis]|uniref:VRR-NUC domain-containing protein n=1 Tax=Micromonospora polyrhachis TaxID=1282883 RepID=A0A7W7SQZ0_9ACTN|nr:hypothetical protein [Micromonospora polyrhachis]MBB4958931.1 hypothetical protein [Micromonospora polyrhachis]
MSRNRDKGTAWETAIVGYLRTAGATQTERRALAGNLDRGDIAGIPGLVIEAKNEKTITLSAYVTEAEQERVNDGARIGLAWVKRRGKTSPGDAYVVMTGDNLIRLLADAGYIQSEAARG